MTNLNNFQAQADLKKQVRIAVIGAGATGLTTAFYLTKAKQEQGLPVEINLIEATNRLGGKIKTLRQDGFVIELGPDSFLARKEAATRLIKALGLEHELVRNETGQAFVLNNNHLYPIPEGAAMGVPTEIVPFVTTGLFSLPGKMRAAFDLFLPRKVRDEEDLSLGEFFRYRFGDEIVENLIEPLLSGIYAGDIDQMSLMATFPQFYQVEKKYRSLILGMKKGMPLPKQRPGERRPGIFQTLKSGLSRISEKIGEFLPPETILLNKEVKSIEKVGEEYFVELANGEKLIYDLVVVTTPPAITAKILASYETVKDLARIPSTSVATVVFAFPKEAILSELKGTGFVVSRRADFQITACTYTHLKWPHTAKKDYILLRSYVGKPYKDEIIQKDDEEIILTVLKDLQKIIDFQQAPLFSFVNRWPKAMPQYIVGHNEMIAKLKEDCHNHCPKLYLAGAAFTGIGVPDCIEQGEKIAYEIISKLRK